jgi:hypothetical protein
MRLHPAQVAAHERSQPRSSLFGGCLGLHLGACRRGSPGRLTGSSNNIVCTWLWRLSRAVLGGGIACNRRGSRRSFSHPMHQFKQLAPI